MLHLWGNEGMVGTKISTYSDNGATAVSRRCQRFLFRTLNVVATSVVCWCCVCAGVCMCCVAAFVLFACQTGILSCKHGKGHAHARLFPFLFDGPNFCAGPYTT